VHNRRQFLVTGAAAAAMLAVPASAAVDYAAFITEVAREAITELSKSDPSDAARAAALKPLLLKYFDMPGIAKHVLGGYWKRIDAAQQQQYVDRFVDYIASVYAKRFQEYNGQQLEVKRVRDEGTGATVFTSIAGADDTRIDWEVRGDGSAPLITDVRVEGLSLADTHRQEFTSVLSQNNGDINALMGIMKQKSLIH
jgi:phospholipid transport system substrate-binding protein